LSTICGDAGVIAEKEDLIKPYKRLPALRAGSHLLDVTKIRTLIRAAGMID
jgi:hypothetical protein